MLVIKAYPSKHRNHEEIHVDGPCVIVLLGHQPTPLGFDADTSVSITRRKPKRKDEKKDVNSNPRS